MCLMIRRVVIFHCILYNPISVKMAVTRRNRSKSVKRKSRKHTPWKGWKKEAPGARERTVMLRECGRKCFLGPKKSFPICKKNTCKVSKKGVWAAYVRAKEWGNPKKSYRGRARPTHRRKTYHQIARKAEKILGKH